MWIGHSIKHNSLTLKNTKEVLLTPPKRHTYTNVVMLINLSWEAQGWLWPLFVNIQGTPKGFEEFSNRSWWSPGALSSIDARSDHNHLPRQLSTAFPCHRCDKCGKVFTQPEFQAILDYVFSEGTPREKKSRKFLQLRMY